MTSTDAPPEQLLADALEALDVSVCIADARLDDQPLVWANAAFERTTGYPWEQVVGRNCRFLQEGIDLQPQVRQVREALQTGQAVTVVLLNRRADGTLFANELSVTPLHDDAGELTHFLALQRDVTDEQEAAAARQRLEDDQSELSRALQRNLVPRTLPEVPGLDVAVRYLPGATSADGVGVSGDFYDLYATSSAVGGAATWNAAIGDVAGRGAGAAAYTAVVRNLLKGISLAEGQPALVLQLLNQALLDELGDRFVTVALAQLQVRRERVRMTVALAGHPQPVLVRQGEAGFVGVAGDLLGVLPEATAHDTRVDLQPGDAVVLYTDGITEAGPAADQFGEERLLEAAQAGAGSAEAVADGVLDAVGQHAGASEDDIAMLVLHVPGER